MKELKYKEAFLTNIIYVAAGLIHFFIWGQPIIAALLVVLGFTSGLFHYYKAVYHDLRDQKTPREQILPTRRKMKIWQDFDVVSIYLIFALYPFQITGNAWWLLWAIPLVGVSLNKLGFLFPSKSTDSTKILGACALVVFPLAFFYLSWWLTLISLAFFVVALLFGRKGDASEKALEHGKHDKKHGLWHIFSGIGFALLGK